MRRYVIAGCSVLLLLTSVNLLSARPLADVPYTELRQRLYSASRAVNAPSGITSRRTLQAKSMAQLIEWTAPVSKSAPAKYVDFETYYRAANLHGQRSGKTLEAVFAWRANQQAVHKGLPSRYLVTAAEGFPGHHADLIEIADGKEIAKYQAKLRLSLKSASRYLADPRYEGMKLVTTRESYRRVVNDLARKEAGALRRGMPLAPSWKRVWNAINSGRFPGQFAGRSLPSLRGVDALTRKSTFAQFASDANRGSYLGRAVFAGNSVLIVYLQYQDTQRLIAGDTQGDLYAGRTALRVLQAGIATYALATVEPGTKLGSAVIAVAMIGVDVGLEIVRQRRLKASHAVLAQIDRDEQFHVARQSLLTLAN